MNDNSAGQTINHIDVIAPNLKRRLSGVTATIAALVTKQATSIPIVATGPGLPNSVPHLRLWRVLFLPRRMRVWHARRNNDLFLGLLLKWLGISRLKVVFTSASPRPRTGWTRFLVSRCDEVIATNQVNADVMPRSCIIIPHGVDTDRFLPAERCGTPMDTHVVGCFGRIRMQKGTKDFVEVLCKLLPARPNWSGIVMGRVLPKDQDFFEGLVNQVESYGLRDQIRFIPEASLEEMPKAYQNLSIYVAPSYLEGFGLTVAEALSAGIPTVATSGVGAFDTLIEPHKNGYLFRPGDVGKLEENLLQLMDDNQLRSEMGRAARESALARFSLDAEADQLVRVYRRLLAG